MMTKFNVGDKVRISGKGVAGLSIGTLAEVVGVDSEGDVWLDNGWFYLAKNVELFTESVPPAPKKSARITALETQVATLQAKVEALEKAEVKPTFADRFPNTARFMQESTEVDGILADIKRKAKPTLESILATYPTPNEQRADVIKRAKTFVSENVHYAETYYDASVTFVVNSKKRTVVALLRDYADVVGKGIAKCDPDDVFNADIGKAIALARALGVEVPQEFVKAVQPTEVVKYHVLESDIYGKLIVTPTKNPEGTHKYTECGLDSPAANGARITDDTDAVYS